MCEANLPGQHVGKLRDAAGQRHPLAGLARPQHPAGEGVEDVEERREDRAGRHVVDLLTRRETVHEIRDPGVVTEHHHVPRLSAELANHFQHAETGFLADVVLPEQILIDQ